MRVLLDTHAFIWMASSPEKLSAEARRTCEEQVLILSVASAWEMAIKARQGKLDIPSPAGDYIRRQARMGSVSLLPFHFQHAVTAGKFDSIHKDPFDRMIAAQCLEEKLPLVTKDPFFRSIGVETIW